MIVWLVISKLFLIVESYFSSLWIKQVLFMTASITIEFNNIYMRLTMVDCSKLGLWFVWILRRTRSASAFEYGMDSNLAISLYMANAAIIIKLRIMFFYQSLHTRPTALHKLAVSDMKPIVFTEVKVLFWYGGLQSTKNIIFSRTNINNWHILEACFHISS